MYRKNTTSILKEWKSYLGKDLNESIMDARQRNECFESLISDLIDCGWEQERIDALVAGLENESYKVSDELLSMIAYGAEESMSGEAQDFADRYQGNSLEMDEDLGDM